MTPVQKGGKAESEDVIQVIVRVRPPANKDRSSCLNVTSQSSIVLHGDANPKDFCFDKVVDQDSKQETVFESVGQKIVEGCIEGYNGTIFAYGQTGSGKTYTMLGPSENFSQGGDRELRGVIPRCLEYLFHLIGKKIELHGDQVVFLCKCSFLEIYREQIYDLLDPAPTSSLQLRESLKRGVFVEGNREQIVMSATDAYKVLEEGWANRHVGSTSMNRESSRSHAVFTVCIESSDRTGDITKVRQSLLNLVDLAGSERQRHTGAVGLRLKEAGIINNSLSVLGNVIMSLVDIDHGKLRHVPYRDSKLTFLLRDSVGGNARTCMIANVHPNCHFFSETLSTLYFAQRAKMIKNRARVNEDAHGDVLALQNEVKRLQRLLAQKDANSKRYVEGDVDYQQYFLQAMEMWRRHSEDSDDVKAKVTSLQHVISKTEKAVMSARMIVKFRDSTILRMREKAAGDSPTGDDVSEEVQSLKREIKTLNAQLQCHPQVAILSKNNDDLKMDIERLKSLPSVRDFIEFTASRKAELIAEFQRLTKDENENDTSTVTFDTARSNLEVKVQGLQAELESSKVKRKEEEAKLMAKVTALEAELATAKREKELADKMLLESQEGARAQVKQLNEIHNSTLRTVTTPQKRGLLGSESNGSSSRKLLRLTPSVNDSLDFGADGSFNLMDVQVNDEMKSASLLVELEAEKEGKKLLEEQVQQLEREANQLREELGSFEGKWKLVQQAMIKQKENNVESQEKLKSDLKEQEKHIDNLKFENGIKTGEIEDLRITLKSVDKQLNDQRQELDNVRSKLQQEIRSVESSRNHALEECSRKTSEAERLSLLVEKLETELMTSSAGADFAREQMTSTNGRLKEVEERTVTLERQLKEQESSHSELSLQLSEEKRQVCSELSEQNQQLRKVISTTADESNALKRNIAELEMRLEASDKAAKSDKVAVSALLQQVSELRGSMSLHEISSEQLRAELEERKEEMNQLSSELDRCNEQKDKYFETLKSLQEQVAITQAKHQFEVDNLQEDIFSFTEQCQKLEADIQEWEEQEASGRREMEEVREKLLRTQIQLKAKEQFAEQLQTDHTNFAVQVAQDRQQADADHQTQLAEAASRLESQATLECEELRSQISSMEARIEEVELSRSALNARLDERNVRLREMEETSKSNEQRMHRLEENEKAVESIKLLLDKERELRLSANKENERMLTENAKLAGHSNHLQKIKYLEKLRTELCTVTNERDILKAKNEKLEQRLSARLSRSSRSPDKRNLLPPKS